MRASGAHEKAGAASPRSGFFASGRWANGGAFYALVGAADVGPVRVGTVPGRSRHDLRVERFFTAFFFVLDFFVDAARLPPLPVAFALTLPLPE